MGQYQHSFNEKCPIDMAL